jgi:hypothetical protein
VIANRIDAAFRPGDDFVRSDRLQAVLVDPLKRVTTNGGRAMKRKLAAVFVCVAMLGIAGGQPPPADVPPLTKSPPPPSAADAIGGGGLIPVPSVHPTAPPVAGVPPTFDALVQELQAVRRQKAELEKREKAITEALLKKFAEQKSQLEALGIPVNPPKPAPAPEIADLLPPVVEKK